MEIIGQIRPDFPSAKPSRNGTLHAFDFRQKKQRRLDQIDELLKRQMEGNEAGRRRDSLFELHKC